MSTLTDLVPKVLAKSREGKLQWELISDKVYVASVGDYMLTIEHDEIAPPTYDIALRKRDGTRIEYLSYHSNEWEMFEALSEIHGLARRKALNIDKVFDEVEQFLNKL